MSDFPTELKKKSDCFEQFCQIVLGDINSSKMLSKEASISFLLLCFDPKLTIVITQLII